MRDLQRRELPVVYNCVAIVAGMKDLLKFPVWATSNEDALAKGIAYCNRKKLNWASVDVTGKATSC